MRMNRNTNRAFAILGLVSALCLSDSAPAQNSRIAGGTVTQPRFGFYWETRLEPPSPPLSGSFSSGATHESGVVHRFMFDRSQNIFLGYDALVEVLPEANTFRVTFRNMTMTPELSRQFSGDLWSQMPTPGWRLPAPQIIHGGDVLSLNLLLSPTTNQRVVDYVTIQEPSRRVIGFEQIPDREFSYVSGSSRDFEVDDVELLIQSPRLSINGTLDETSSQRYDKVSGGIVWIYTAKRGRFLLSLVPRPELGFRKAGEVRGSSLSFVIGNDTFSLNTGARIAPGQAAYSLYVLHEPDWKPTYLHADTTVFNMNVVDAESLRRK